MVEIASLFGSSIHAGASSRILFAAPAANPPAAIVAIFEPTLQISVASGDGLCTDAFQLASPKEYFGDLMGATQAYR